MDWPRWRGPDNDGMARGDAPLHWSDTEHIKWKAEIPGRGHSSPVIWGDKVFVTTASHGAVHPPRSLGRGGRGSVTAVLNPSKSLILMALDRNTGKLLWQQVAKIATPHEGYHPTYGSFASNSPVTDGKYVVAFFGSRGVYCYDLDGKKDLGKRFRHPVENVHDLRRRRMAVH